MNFSSALEELKLGQKVAREGWNGKGLYVRLMPAQSVTLPIDATNNFYTRVEQFFVIHNEPKVITNTWVPSVSDLLANDWRVVK